MADRFAEVSVITHDGLVRDHNEDSVVVGPWTACATVTTAPATFALPLAAPAVVAVADGLGGHPAGEVASSVVVQTLARLAPQLDDAEAVRNAVETCNSAVYAEAARDPAREGMGTTVAGVVLTAGDAYVFNVGDSRVYSYGPDGLRQISVDDSPLLPPWVTQHRTHYSDSRRVRRSGAPRCARLNPPHRRRHALPDLHRRTQRRHRRRPDRCSVGRKPGRGGGFRVVEGSDIPAAGPTTSQSPSRRSSAWRCRLRRRIRAPASDPPTRV